MGSHGERAVSGRVIVVGSVNVDLVVTAARLPTLGETVTGGTFARHHGGKSANQAVAAARLGARAVFVGAIGDDELGRDASAALEGEGIDLSELRVHPQAPTGVALIAVDAQGENLITVASGANAALEAADVEAALDRVAPVPTDVVLVGCEIPLPAVRAALASATSAGARTVLNPAPADGLDRSVFGLADILTPNRGELASIVAHESRRLGRSAPSSPERAARMLLERNAEGDGVRQAVLVSLGAAGALLVEAAGAAIELPAARVRAVDTVGAGDTLNGALAAGLAAGLALSEAARRAVAAAGLAVTRAGAREGMPTATELDAAHAGG
jgi:ribokinase